MSPELFMWIVGGLVSIVIMFAGWVWNDTRDKYMETRKNIHEIRGSIPSTYERQEITRQRDNVSQLFALFRDHETADRDRHDDLVKLINENHSQMLREVRK